MKRALWEERRKEYEALQSDFTPSAPPEELVTSLYPSLEGLVEELDRDECHNG